MPLELTNRRISGVKSDSGVAELFGDGPQVGFSCRMTRWIVPQSEKICFTPSYVRTTPTILENSQIPLHDAQA